MTSGPHKLPHISKECPLLLASGSPRRKQLLGELQIPFVSRAPDTDESQLPGDTPETFLKRVVEDKLSAGMALAGDQPHAGVLVADTSVIVDGEILGKPRDLEDAVRLVGLIAGRTHRVLTRYALGRNHSEALARTVETRVTLRALTPEQMKAYAHTGEGLDKAGGYAAQGLGSFLIERLDGSYSNVVGLPTCNLVNDLLSLGWLERFPLGPHPTIS